MDRSTFPGVQTALGGRRDHTSSTTSNNKHGPITTTPLLQALPSASTWLTQPRIRLHNRHGPPSHLVNVIKQPHQHIHHLGHRVDTATTTDASASTVDVVDAFITAYDTDAAPQPPLRTPQVPLTAPPPQRCCRGHAASTTSNDVHADPHGRRRHTATTSNLDATDGDNTTLPLPLMSARMIRFYPRRPSSPTTMADHVSAPSNLAFFPSPVALRVLLPSNHIPVPVSMLPSHNIMFAATTQQGHLAHPPSTSEELPPEGTDTQQGLDVGTHRVGVAGIVYAAGPRKGPWDAVPQWPPLPPVSWLMQVCV
ncbi:hypothetical protein GALMADRAFT_160313 [Galerina marginata CBS 339.88]|uniref:Uncharacterized protein n=1 Tax=Galerina marginata (strain CBS 339.88) TaxID=685588 RepID=A0A067SQ67_GALM3|nr:hypothetical protein GALMADRAFT_160313 [Galerina marginata CBS 339.88]